METYKDLYTKLCSCENLELAFKKARKRKTKKGYVIEFEANLEGNLRQLRHELEDFTYSQAPLTTFIIRDPKTRKISSSHFRDRVVHHALCNVIAPILEKSFIYDSFANQKYKGTHLAIKRAQHFIRKVAQRYGMGRYYFSGYALKADIRHYFDTVDHEILLGIIEQKIKDPGIIWLIKIILKNHKAETAGKGMPIGNLTSQFFANVYLNEFDKFVKNELRAKYYIRYVDDFAIFHKDKRQLENWKGEIDRFLRSNLKLELHNEKSRIIEINRGVTMLGFRVFHDYKLLKKSNARRIWKRLEIFKQRYEKGELSKEKILQSLGGWLAYAEFANTYGLRKRIIAQVSDILTK